MAKFVKLENGIYLNVDQVIAIDSHVAYILGFDSDWSAHSVELTNNDLKRVLAATGSGNDKYNPIQDLESVPDTTLSKHVAKFAINLLMPAKLVELAIRNIHENSSEKLDSLELARLVAKKMNLPFGLVSSRLQNLGIIL